MDLRCNKPDVHRAQESLSDHTLILHFHLTRIKLHLAIYFLPYRENILLSTRKAGPWQFIYMRRVRPGQRRGHYSQHWTFHLETKRLKRQLYRWNFRPGVGAEGIIIPVTTRRPGMEINSYHFVITYEARLTT
jgi:hypothetical protein